MRVCSIEGCGRVHDARGLCQLHYQRLRRTGVTGERGPLVCVCPEPDADLHRDAGMCQRCKRKPIALMNVSRPVPFLLWASSLITEAVSTAEPRP